MKNFRTTIHQICHDTTHGSSVLVEQIIGALYDYNPSPSEEQWALQQLQGIDQTMVVVHHFLRAMAEDHSTLHEKLERYISTWNQVEQQIAKQLAALLRGREMTVLLHSHSGVVIKVLDHLMEAGYHLAIVQTVSVPGEEGRVQCAELRKMGLDVQLIEDRHLDQWVDKIDVCLLGVDQYDEESFVNKVGSGQIVDILDSGDVPICVIGDTRKKVDKIHPPLGSLFELVAFGPHVMLVTEEGQVR